MSAQKSASKTEKAKQLRDVRHRLQWTQQQMAEALGLDASYLSQLENGRRKLDDWYLKKAGEFEKGKTAKIYDKSTPDAYSMQTSAESCLAYLTRFLGTCKVPAHVVWTYVELQQRFPLEKWTAPEQEINSAQPSAAVEKAPKPAAASDRDRPKP
ncbi:MAG TPA: helix-turn-helix transcriptional regulator [Verrucomicrobiae bacterium]|jgi:DNA-binding XRE family transcriptional regulator|nr:helix-turn-helix transcriptional regulator [Verrucomicrobiae bacterium]